MGLTRRDQGNIAFDSSKSPQAGSELTTTECDNDEIENVLVAETRPSILGSSAPNYLSAMVNNTMEIRSTFIKKQSEELAAAAAVAQPTGPRIRLLPHQHTLFCERKVL